MIKPIFVDGVLEGYAATMAHHSDVGGIAPGSIAVHATEIYQEGLRIPLSKLVDAGVENTMLLRLIEANTRQPVHVLGDLRAQLAACRVGERGLTALIERYGADAHVYMDELQRVAERMMRAELAKLPDGVHTFTDYIDGVGDEPGADPHLRARRDRRRRGADRLRGHLAAGRGERQLPGRDGLRRVLLRHPRHRPRRDPELRGLHDADHGSTPRRARSSTRCCPAACGARGVIGYRVYDAIMGALAPIVPDRVIAAGEGGPTLIAWGGYDEERQPFGTTEVLVGSWGARSSLDGLEGVSNPLANLGNQPVELIEADLPLRVERYGVVPDSGGAGPPARRARVRARVRAARATGRR